MNFPDFGPMLNATALTNSGPLAAMGLPIHPQMINALGSHFAPGNHNIQLGGNF